MALALLVPTDGAEQLGLVPAAGVSGGCCLNRPSGVGGDREALRVDQGWQPPLASADGTKRSGLVLGAGADVSSDSGTGSRCKQWASPQHVGAKNFQ